MKHNYVAACYLIESKVKERTGRHSRNRNAYTGNIRDSNPRTGQDSQHHYLQFGRIPTILKKSFVIATPFLFSLLYLNGFETGSLLEIVAEREEGDARPQLLASLLHNW